MQPENNFFQDSVDINVKLREEGSGVECALFEKQSMGQNF